MFEGGSVGDSENLENRLNLCLLLINIEVDYEKNSFVDGNPTIICYHAFDRLKWSYNR